MHTKYFMFIFCIFVTPNFYKMNDYIESLSTSEYAFKSDIKLQEHFPLEGDVFEEVYYTFKSGKRFLVAKKYKNLVHALNCFPFSFYSKPKESAIRYVLAKTSINIGFLNKKKPTIILLTYIDLIIKNKYYIYGYNIKAKEFSKYIDFGKEKELEEMDLETRKYIWEKKFKTLNKKIKVKIMNKDRFEKTKKETNDKLTEAVSFFIHETNEFIHNKLISDYCNIPLHTVKRYSDVFKEDIDRHNRNNYGHTSYHEYTFNLNLITFDRALKNLYFTGKKINIANVVKEISKYSKEERLHRNTISKYFNLKDIKDEEYKQKIRNIFEKYTP